jgi:hypothetical protein
MKLWLYLLTQRHIKSLKTLSSRFVKFNEVYFVYLYRCAVDIEVVTEYFSYLHFMIFISDLHTSLVLLRFADQNQWHNFDSLKW